MCATDEESVRDFNYCNRYKYLFKIEYDSIEINLFIVLIEIKYLFKM